MKKNLMSVYMDVLDRIHLNEKSTKHIVAKKQYEKDIELKEELDKVIKNRSEFDIYYKKDTLELCIDNIQENIKNYGEAKRNYFNRIDIE